MVNITAPRGQSALSSLANIGSALQNAEEVLDVKSGGAFLKFAKGTWIANNEDTIENTDIWALNPFTMIHGFVDFDASKQAQERIVPITQPRPDRATLPPQFETSKNGWQPVIGVEMVCVEGDFEGETYMFKTNSYGGRKLMSDYLKHLQHKIAAGDETVVALVNLDKDSYTHKDYGLTYNPVFTYRDWKPMDDKTLEKEAKAVEKDTAPEEESVEDDAAEAPAEAAPRRRRRQRKT